MYLYHRRQNYNDVVIDIVIIGILLALATMPGLNQSFSRLRIIFSYSNLHTMSHDKLHFWNPWSWITAAGVVGILHFYVWHCTSQEKWLHMLPSHPTWLNLRILAMECLQTNNNDMVDALAHVVWFMSASVYRVSCLQPCESIKWIR